MISGIMKVLASVISFDLRPRLITLALTLIDYSRYHKKPHPIIVYFYIVTFTSGQDESNSRWSYLAPSGLPAVSCMKNFPGSHILNPWLTKLVRSRCKTNNLCVKWNQFCRASHLYRSRSASWLVRSSPNRTVGIRTLPCDIMLCSSAGHFNLTVPLSA